MTPPPLWHRAVDVAVVALLMTAGAWGFAPLFSGDGWIIAAAGAIALGLALGAAGTLLRVPLMLTTLTVMIAYFLFGGALALPGTTAAGVVPTGRTVRELAVGAVTSWKDLLTVQVPTEGIEVVHLVPFITLLVCSAVAAGLALRKRGAAWAVLPAAVALVVAIAFGTYRAAAPVAQGLLFAGASVAWLAWRKFVAKGGEGLGSGRGVRRAVTAAGVLTLSLVAGGAWGASMAPSGQRVVIRDQIVPPLELHDYPSPLQSFRALVRDKEEAVLFTVEGLPEDTRIRLATLDSYNGVVYSVSGDGSGVGGSFEPVGSVIPVDAQGDSSEVTVTVGALGGVWVPTIGHLRQVTFGGSDATALQNTLHYNRTTSTAVVTEGLREGDTYSFDAVVPTEPTSDDIAGAALSAVPLPRMSVVPEGLRAIAVEAIGSEADPAAQVAALEEYLSASGFFSHGLKGQAPSRSGHGAERVSELFTGEKMVGDQEQYAVAFALLAHELGIPARVVMGFDPERTGDGPVEVTGSDVTVWAEVAHEGFGWVAVDPTPAEDRVPVDEETPPQREPRPQVLQPPPPPQEPAEVPPAIPVEDEAIDEPTNALETVMRVAVYVVGGLGILAILLGPALVIVIAKARRRRKRRRAATPADRVAGGWNEIADAAADYGVSLAPQATRVEKSSVVDTAFDGVATTHLATRADHHVWGPGDVDDATVEAYWRDVAGAIRTMHQTRGWRTRTAARLSARSLVKSPSGRGARKAKRSR